MEEELIILAVYVNVNGLSKVQVDSMMREIVSNYEITFEDILTKKIKTLFFPIQEGQTRVECIYPNSKYNGEVESQIINLYKAILNSSDEQIKDFVQELERKLKLIKLKENLQK